VSQYGMGWTKIGEVFGERNGKQCRERWYNHLDPAVNKGEWTVEVRDSLLIATSAKVVSSAMYI
jgi:Myb-like DNA-binding domain